MTLISIIIPTMRPENSNLESLFKIKISNDYYVEYIFIIDNPDSNIEFLTSLKKKYHNNIIKILKNKSNLGAPATRNIGIENSSGNFVLFIDDDCSVKENLLIEYINAYKEDPSPPGYIGVTSSPNPNSSFEHAVKLSDMQHFFDIARFKDKLHWGITANIFFKRDAIGDIRFSTNYPKKGGGEDIHFCLKVIENYKKNNTKERLFKSVSSAEIIHPFWNENYRSYLRFYRWGYGDVNLHNDFPNYCFRQYPNLIEFLFFFLLLNGCLIFLSFYEIINYPLIPLFYTILFSIIGLILWEHICEASKLSSQNRKYTFISLLKAVFIRQLNDWGRFLHQFPRFWEFTKRWDYFCTGEAIKYERNIALRKFLGFSIIYIILLSLILYLNYIRF